MFETIAVPLWVLILILLFAAVTALERILGPTARWFFRRRMERVVARLNARLERPIQPFKLARRHDMIQRLLYDPKVAEAVTEHARLEGIPENVAFEEAKGYAREIVPAFSASAYFGPALRFARWLSRALYQVHLDDSNDAALRAIDSEATVIFVMNHRSNMDYVLVTYLVAQRSALSYAVGEWARVWPLSRLIRAMGAFFIRRKSRNTLYRRVLARYVQLATRGGVTQAIFPEGGLSLDGADIEARAQMMAAAAMGAVAFQKGLG
ncbi:MAG: 1-acyl-sn-glycerol-3-phosphate acyltransferase, partial [Rhodobacter sp.]|nr:1-acyl-sn-glycerol-3-phosphate acyltransferase [Rhodobacter sp.]